MKYMLLSLLLLIPTHAFAQENTLQQRIEITLGKLIIENATLAANVESLNKQIIDLKKQLEEKKDNK